MQKMDLAGIWKIAGGGYNVEGTIPGSVYSILLKNNLIDMPFYRMNELSTLALTEKEFIFSRKFIYDGTYQKATLVCEGIDTLSNVYINEMLVGTTDNMHRTYRFDVSKYLIVGENVIKISFPPLNTYLKEKQAKNPIFGSQYPMGGFMHVRKAHCMLGWDFGLRLPDAGIWRPIYLIDDKAPHITRFDIDARQENGRWFITPHIETNVMCNVSVIAIAPDGRNISLSNNMETEVLNPQLWYPNGLGNQALYTVNTQILVGTEIIDSQSKKIGLRTLTLVREQDEFGESFCHEINGIRFFAMGSNYIPEDNILSHITKERTHRLLTACKEAHFNVIRVWGGGYYPEDYFFELCDELGLVVFMDLPFACSSYPFGGNFTESVIYELDNNLTRIRHHACLGLIAGNNEIEEIFARHTAWKSEWLTDEQRKDYLELFENIIPEKLQEFCPNIPYIPSSPTSHGGFVDTQNENIGDTHYWGVWAQNEPFTEYRKHYPRYLSEFGFQSFPCEKTIDTFTVKEDKNIFSRVMEMHQRNGMANGKIMEYMQQMFLYPTNFSSLLYASQLLQAEAIRYCVEHLRRNRGRCMGALYWQLNDIAPVASWSSIDYYGRYKALQYVAKRFFSPILISCEETGERFDFFGVNKEDKSYQTKARFCVTNDTIEDVSGKVIWKLCDNSGKLLREGSSFVKIPKMSVIFLDELDFDYTNAEKNYLWYAFEIAESIVSQGTVLFTPPKYFEFKDPKLQIEMEGEYIKITSSAYAKYVEIYSPDSDFILSDNYFDMNVESKEVKIISGTPKTILIRSVYDIR